MLSTGVLPHWVGWIALVYGLAGLGLFGFTGDSYPFMHHLLPILMGILLLLRRSQLPARSHGEEASPAAESRGGDRREIMIRKSTPPS